MRIHIVHHASLWLLTAIVALTSACGRAFSEETTQAAPPINGQEICGEDKNVALINALKRHSRLEEYLLHLKGLPQNESNVEFFKSLNESSAQFQDIVTKFLDQSPSSGLILYAVDQRYLCAFMWGLDRKLIYARTLNEDKLLVTAATDLSATILARGASRSAAIQARVGEMQDLSAVMKRVADVGQQTSEAWVQSLSDALFPIPFRDALSKVKSVTIIPVGSISSIPISLLHPLGTDERVLDRFSINILLFASELRKQRKPWSANFKNPLIMGNPKGSDNFKGYPPIPAATIEAQFVAAKYKVEPILGTDATSIEFLDRASRADLIYLATHGIAGDERSNSLRNSYIVLSDNRMPATTILRLRPKPIQARLVVLSACQTGLGWVTEGGVIGLARTFLDAGAGNVVMTTWNVDDTATRVLMENFVNQLDFHQPAEALRLAQLETMKSYPDPVYWAAFNTYGNPFLDN